MSNTAIALLITILAVTVARIQIRRLVRSGIRLAVLAVMIRRASAKELKLLSLVTKALPREPFVSKVRTCSARRLRGYGGGDPPNRWPLRARFCSQSPCYAGI